MHHPNLMEAIDLVQDEVKLNYIFKPRKKNIE